MLFRSTIFSPLTTRRTKNQHPHHHQHHSHLHHHHHRRRHRVSISHHRRGGALEDDSTRPSAACSCPPPPGTEQLRTLDLLKDPGKIWKNTSHIPILGDLPGKTKNSPGAKLGDQLQETQLLQRLLPRLLARSNLSVGARVRCSWSAGYVGGDPVQHCWLGHCKVLNSPMTPASRLTCTVQVECLWFLVGICLFCTCFGTWYLLFWRAYGVMAFGRGLL